MLLIGHCLLRTVSESQTKHSNTKNSFLVSSMETFGSHIAHRLTPSSQCDFKFVSMEYHQLMRARLR
jgi:hypothetical protein